MVIFKITEAEPSNLEFNVNFFLTFIYWNICQMIKKYLSLDRTSVLETMLALKLPVEQPGDAYVKRGEGCLRG